MKETPLCCNSLCPSRRLGRSPDGATSFRPATRVHLQQSHEGFHAYWCLSNLINAWCVCHNSTHKHCQRINLHPLASCEHVSAISIDSLVDSGVWRGCSLFCWSGFNQSAKEFLEQQWKAVVGSVTGTQIELVLLTSTDWLCGFVWLRMTSCDFVVLRLHPFRFARFRKVLVPCLVIFVRHCLKLFFLADSQTIQNSGLQNYEDLVEVVRAELQKRAGQNCQRDCDLWLALIFLQCLSSLSYLKISIFS